MGSVQTVAGVEDVPGVGHDHLHVERDVIGDEHHGVSRRDLVGRQLDTLGACSSACSR